MKNFLLDDNGRNHIKFFFLKDELKVDDPEKFYNDVVIFSNVIAEKTHKRKGYKLAVGECDGLVWLMQCVKDINDYYVVNFYFNNENVDDFMAEMKVLEKFYSAQKEIFYGKRASKTSTN